MPNVRIILPVCLFLSGLCALAYQVTWARYLANYLGATAPAYTIVLATFMGGLAGGAWLLGRLADRTRRPLRLYGRLEILVGVLCFMFPWIIDLLGSVYLFLAAPFLDQPLPRGFLRVGMAVTVLAVPSLLMGGTLPAASRFYVRALDQVGEGVARLYYVNALGAVIGALLAGFFLIPLVGLNATFWIAALVNCGIGCWALWVSGRVDGASACPAPGRLFTLEDEDPGPRETRLPMWVAVAALVATGSSGAASMIYEVSWIRLLTLVLGGSTYAFTVMVAAFILGIAIGSWLVSWWRPLAKGGLGAFGWLETSVAFVVIAMVPIYNRLSYWFLEATAGMSRQDGYYPLYLFFGFLICFAVMMIPTVLLGATFPLAARLSTRSIDRLGGSVGRAYAFNTGGTILGTVVAAHILFPIVGLYGTFVFAASLNLLAGVGCLGGAWWLRFAKSEGLSAHQGSRHQGVAPVAGLVGMLAAFVVLVGWGPRIDNAVFSQGVFRSTTSGFASYHEFRSWLVGGIDLHFYKDGPEGSVSVVDARGQMVLNVNGKPEASSSGDMPTQLCIAHLPVMLHHAPERALLVGLGGGATAGALLTHESLDTTTVELSPQVVEANRYFSEHNRNVLDNPRLDLVVEDAKAYLGLTRESFDIIISQPSNPWVAGNSDLFTLEFFELMRDRLAPGGMMVQWFHDYEMTDEAIRTILNTFAGAFPETRLFHCGDGRDYILVGTVEPLEPDLERIEKVLSSNDEARKDMKRYLGIRSPYGVLARNVLDDAGVRFLGQGASIHRDHRPVLDFLAPRGVFLRSMSGLIVTADQRWEIAEDNDLLIHRATSGRIPRSDDVFEELVDSAMDPFEDLRVRLLDQWVSTTAGAEAKRRLAAELTWSGLTDRALALLSEIEEDGLAEENDVLERWNLEALHAYQNDDDESVDLALEKMSVVARKTNLPAHFDRLADMAELLERPSIAADAWRAAVLATEPEAKWQRIRRLIGLARASRESGCLDSAREALDSARVLREDYWPLVLEEERLERRLAEGSASG